MMMIDENLAGEARGEGDGETRGEAEERGECGLLNVLCHHYNHHHYYLLADPGIREFGLLIEGELQRPRPPGDFDRFLIEGDHRS